MKKMTAPGYVLIRVDKNGIQVSSNNNQFLFSEVAL